jgi:multidrug efflux pump subunit AcrB
LISVSNKASSALSRESARYLDKDTKISTGLKPTVLIVAQIQEPLSQHYRIGLNIEQLKLGREIACEQLRSQQQTIVNDVTRAYYAIVQSQSAVQTAEENIKLYRELDRVTTDYVAQRVALKSENLDVKTRLAKAEYDLLTLGDTIATQKEQLNNLLGRDIRVEFNVSLPLETVGFEADLDAARSRALNQRPEIKKALLELQRAEIDRRIKKSEFIPDVWQPIIIRDPNQTTAKMNAAAGDKYSYREIDDFTDAIEKTIKTIPVVSKVTRSGILDEKIYLEYSQERLASYGIQSGTLQDILKARNITVPGGQVQVEGKNLTIDPSGEFKSEREIGDVMISASAGGAQVYLRDLVDTVRSYNAPARYLNFFTWRDNEGNWNRTRAITLSIQMRAGEKIGDFGEAVDATLADLKKRLPEDLIIARTSDQPLQVTENVHLFMNSLYEAIALVVLVSLVGFWEWRSALLMAFSIPLTLAMTFGMMYMLGIDIQQVSIATLIIALGLLVDDPVVAGDAIKRDLALGHPPIVSAWLGPTKLAAAIMYATITNIVAYLPFMMLSGDTGKFMYSLPIVLACSLVASRLVSMSFIPLLGYYLLKPKAEMPIEERRKKGFAAKYYRIGTWAINHRWRALGMSLVFLALGGFFMSQLKTQYLPKDLSYLSYVDVWLPEDAPLLETNKAASEAEEIIQDQQLNYAQIIIQVTDKHDTGHLVGLIQKAVSTRIAGARIDIRQLESGGSSGLPVSIRISGDDMATLRSLAEQTKAIFRNNERRAFTAQRNIERAAVRIQTGSRRRRGESGQRV